MACFWVLNLKMVLYLDPLGYEKGLKTSTVTLTEHVLVRYLCRLLLGSETGTMEVWIKTHGNMSDGQSLHRRDQQRGVHLVMVHIALEEENTLGAKTGVWNKPP